MVKENDENNLKINNLLLEATLFHLNTFHSQEINSFLKSDAFFKIQNKREVLETLMHKVLISKKEEEILKIIRFTIKEVSQKRNCYDEAWKTILPVIIKDVIEYFSPLLYQTIDWAQGIEDAKEELDALYALSNTRDRTADAIFKVILKHPINTDTIHINSFGKMMIIGNRAYIILHVEVQNKKLEDFGLRMFQMQYRLIDRYHAPLYSIAFTSFHTQEIENFSYKVAETEIGCKFKCINLLHFKTDKGKAILKEMKDQKKLLPFVIEAHLFLFLADRKKKGSTSNLDLEEKFSLFIQEIEDYPMTLNERKAFLSYLGRLFESKYESLPLSRRNSMLEVPNNNDSILAQRIDAFLKRQFDIAKEMKKMAKESKEKIAEMEKRVKEETERRVKEETEKRVKEETEKRVKEETERRVKGEAEAAYTYCELRAFEPQEKISKESFMEMLLSLGDQATSQTAHFAKKEAKNMDDVLLFIKKNLP